MIYLDNGATTLYKPDGVLQAVTRAMLRCANPGRGGYPASMEAAKTVLRCRESVAEFFECQPEQVVFTANCTQGLNIAVKTLVKPGDKVLVSGFEHNAVTRPLHALNAKITVAGRKLFDPVDTLLEWETALKKGVDAAVFTHVSNVFGYILPVAEMARLCKVYGVPFIIDAAQSAGIYPVSLRALGADFIAMPGHKGLLGPQGTGILLCNRLPEALLQGGTGSDSHNQAMPDFLPDRAEAGTLNVPGIAGLNAGIRYLSAVGIAGIAKREQEQAQRLANGLKHLGIVVFSGKQQGGTVSFVPEMDCEEFAGMLAKKGIATRAGLHCAPLAHESAGTLESGTVRVSFGHDAAPWQTDRLLQIISGIYKKK